MQETHVAPQNVIDDGQCCAYDSFGRNESCMENSGGPLQYFSDHQPPEIVGILSFGLNCSTTLPSVYTRISYYLDWIESIVWPNIEMTTPYTFVD